MNYGSMLGNSLAYTKDGLLGKWKRWILLFICTVIFPLFWGYQWRIYRGEPRMPQLDDWVGMFIDGIKLLVVSIIYFIVPMIIFIAIGGAGILMGRATDSLGTGALIGTLIGMLIGVLIFFIFSLIAMMALVRFARTDSFREAFNLSAIVAHIGKIGWLRYILALIILWIIIAVSVFVLILVVGVVSVILALIPIIGLILGAILNIVVTVLIGPFVGVFSARYMTQIYDSAGGHAPLL